MCGVFIIKRRASQESTLTAFRCLSVPTVVRCASTSAAHEQAKTLDKAQSLAQLQRRRGTMTTTRKQRTKSGNGDRELAAERAVEKAAEVRAERMAEERAEEGVERPLR